MKNELLNAWKAATDKLARAFARHYFGKDAEIWWIADEIGGVLHVNDYFFSMIDIADFTKYKYSRAKMFEYYDYALEAHKKGEVKVNIKNYGKLKHENNA